METLITASIGLYLVGKAYYLQIISAERYQFYFVPIDKAAAYEICEQENLQIDITHELPEGMILQPASN
jgi:hypothetical protein